MYTSTIFYIVSFICKLNTATQKYLLFILIFYDALKIEKKLIHIPFVYSLINERIKNY